MSIQLRRLKKEDNHQITSLLNNKKIWDHLKDYIPYPYQLQDADDFIRLVNEQLPVTSFGISIDTKEVCGVISLIPQTDLHRMSAEIGYWIGEKYWGQGIATKAIELITIYGFEELNLRRIFAGVFSFNVGSMKALEKNGYQCEGILKNAILKNNKIVDEHVYAKLNPKHR